MLVRLHSSKLLTSLEDYKQFTPFSTNHARLIIDCLADVISPRLLYCVNMAKVHQLCVFYPLPTEYIPPHFFFVGHKQIPLEETQNNNESKKAEEKKMFIYQRKLVSVELTGGLGNRLFQVAAAHHFAQHNHKTLCFVRSLIQPCAHSPVACYEDSVFPAIPFAENFDFENTEILSESPEQFSQFVMWSSNASKNTILKGYFQSPYYIHNSFTRECLVEHLSNRKIQRPKTCFLHIRRGDYVNNPFHYVNLTAYYLEAIRRMFVEHNVSKIVICSNDIEWCKKQWYLSNNDRICFDEEKDELKTLYLMASCSHGGICSNSSFSWWGAWLSEACINYIPSKWLPSVDWKTEFHCENRLRILDVDTWFLPIFYINCQHRVDRNNSCQHQLFQRCKIDPKFVTRVEAIYLTSRGHLGCAASHVQILQQFLEVERYPAVMIIEDDFESMGENFTSLIQFLTTQNREDILNSFEGILLGGGQIQQESCGMDNCARRIASAQETIAYVVNRKGARKLLETWKESIVSLDDELIEQHSHCIDQKWKTLHQQGCWYITNPLLCRQQYSYSDIEKRWKC